MNTKKHMNLLSTPVAAAAFALCLLASTGGPNIAKAATSQEPAVQAVTSRAADAAKLKDAILNAAMPTSATVKWESSTDCVDVEGNCDEYTYTDVIKIDAHGDELKTSSESHTSFDEDVKVYTKGDDCVAVTDDVACSCSAEDWQKAYANVYDALCEDGQIGLARVAEMATSVEKEQRGDKTVYHVSVDTVRYDQEFTAMNDEGAGSADDLKDVTVDIAFDKDGHIVMVDEKVNMTDGTSSEWKAEVSDIDNTKVDAMPKAEKTLEDLIKEQPAA